MTVVDATTGTELFRDREIVAMRVDGELLDLSREVAAGTRVEPVFITEPDGLQILRHSAAHVMAQAVQQANPDAKLGIGPPIVDGFYFDFDVDEPFTPDDLKIFTKSMQRIIRSAQRFERRVVTVEEAREAMRDEPYKLELIGLKSGASDEREIDADESVEVGAGELTIYANVDRNTGETVWQDLCRGPHLPNTRMVGEAFSLERMAAAYWRGSEKNKQLQRIYGTAWPTKDDLRAYHTRLEEAAKRDHRKLGAELDLFSFPEELGSGLPVFHPKGGVLKRVMEDYVRQRHVDEGFEYVGTPHISKEQLFYTSGHLPHYGENQYPAFRVDEERDAEGRILKEGTPYRLKAMNCPMHNLIYRSRARSYRDLPLRLFEFGHVYRYEKSGAVHGLTRVRGFAQDDSHSYVAVEDAGAEIRKLLNFVLSVLRDFGMNDFYLELSTRDPESDKFIGSDEQWEEATRTLREVAEESGLDLVPDPGGAAFYGPKISVQARDAIGRTWQMSTVQLDFNQPERFDLEYVASDGTRKRPVMIHAAKFGSIERFIGVLTEHYAGAFPLWLSPVQVVGVPVAEEFGGYLDDVLGDLKRSGLRVEADHGDERMQKKIRTHTLQRVPVILLAGAKDRDAQAVSLRFRDGSQTNGVPRARALDALLRAQEEHRQLLSADDLADLLA